MTTFAGKPPAPFLLGAVALSLAAGSLGSRPVNLAALFAAVLLAWAVRTGVARGAILLVVVVAGLAFGAGRSQVLAVETIRPHALGPGAQATVEDAPRADRFGWRSVARVNGHRLLLRGSGRPPRWTVGDVALVTGAVRAPGPDEGWLRARRIEGVANIRAGPVAGRRGGLSGLVDGVRRRANASLTAGLAPPAASLLRGMVLGDESSMAPGLRNRMRTVGLGHIVAASGANVAILVALVLATCAVLGLGFRTRLVLCMGAVGLYAPLCGSGPSIVRASIAGIALLVAAMASRPSSRWNALLLAAAVTLSLDPQAWRDVAWQLSYAAVLGIGVLAAPMCATLVRRGVPERMAEGTAVTVAATAATAPVSVAAFGKLSLVSLPVNVLAAPLVVPATWLGIAAGTVGQVDTRLGVPFTSLARLPVAGLLAIVEIASRVPFAQVAAGPVAASSLVVAALAVVAATRAPRWRRSSAAVCAAALLVPVAWQMVRPADGPGAPPAGGSRVSFLDVGQGDATLFQSRGRSMMVDTGPQGSGVVRLLEESGVERLDVLLVTHAQADHLGEAAQVLRSIPVGLLIDGRSGVSEPAGREMAREARARGVRVLEPQAGDRFDLGELTFEVLWPSGNSVAGTDPNLRCVTLRVLGPGSRLLLGGDAESDVLIPLRAGPVDILKVSHHGSADPGLGRLLEELEPSMAVIEVGSRNRYGHPDSSTLASLGRAGVEVRRTDLNGTVRVDLSERGMRVQGPP